jgi:hypothetical protein
MVREAPATGAPRPRLLDRVREEIRLRHYSRRTFSRHQLMIRSQKGQKDRLTMLPTALETDLAGHINRVLRQHAGDVARGAGWVELPFALARKYPQAGREPGWQWVFPATRFYVDRETGQRRRHHLHESVLKRAVRRPLCAPGSPSRYRVTPSGIRSRRT